MKSKIAPRNSSFVVLLVASLALAIPSLISAQTPVKKPVPVVAAKPVAKPAPVAAKAVTPPVKPAAAPVATMPPHPVASTPAGQPVNAAPVAKTGTSTNAVGTNAAPTNGATAGQAVTPASAKTAITPASTTGATTAAAVPAGQSSAPRSFVAPSGGDPRSAVATQGLGTFLGGGWTMTAYGCFRTGTRVLCDFDVLPPSNTGINAGAFGPWVALVDDGGKITAPHNAFFQAADGSQLTTAYADTSNPLRLLMEYDNVSPNFNSVALVHGADRIAGVPITPADPNVPEGTILARGAAPSAPGGTATPGAAADKASGTVDTVNQQVQDKKAKAKSFWQKVQDLQQTATQK
jgi:hypothetical protein